MGRAFYADLPAHLRFLLVALCDHANDEGGSIFVGQKHLALKTGAGVRSVGRNLKELRDLGYIDKVGRLHSRGQDIYRVEASRLPTTEDIRVLVETNRGRTATLADRPSTTGELDLDPPPVSGVDRPPMATEPSVEPRSKPLERERNIAFDALAEATGSDPTKLTRSAARMIGVALAEIMEAETSEVAGAYPPDIVAKNIRRAAVLFRQRRPEWDLTPMSLAKWWPTCQETVYPATIIPPTEDAAGEVWEGDPPWVREGITWEQWQRRVTGETDVGSDPARPETGLPSGGLPSGEVGSGPALPAEGTG
jgi:hypothetical protein